MPKFKDERYTGYLQQLTERTGFQKMEKPEFEEGLARVKHKFKAAARALCILLYYTGARPSEILSLTTKNFKVHKTQLKILMPTMKKGEVRPLTFSLSNPHFREVRKFALSGWLPEHPIFFRLRGYKKKIIKNKKGEKKVYFEISHLLWHFVKDWFKCTPYFFRQNHFSRMYQKKASLEDIRQIKGAKTLASVLPYIKMSDDDIAKISKKYMRD